MLRQVLFATGLACTGYGLLVFLARAPLMQLIRFPPPGVEVLPVDAALLVLLGVWAMTWASDGWWKPKTGSGASVP